jgi:hypothetical protein
MSSKKEYSYICLTCNLYFLHCKKDKKYCSHKCFSSRHGTITKLCETCNKDFTVAYRFRNQKACGIECSKSVIAKTLTTKGELFCVTCSKNFYQTQYNIKHGAKYCSKICESKDHRKEVACKNCGKITSCIKSQNKQFCNRKCASTGEFNAQYGKTGSLSVLYGKHAWSKGLTTETDSRLKSLGEKLSTIIKEQFKQGIRNHHGEKNPMYGHTPDMVTIESRKRYSLASINRILSGKGGYGRNRIIGYSFSEKMNKKFLCKSSWEVLAVLCLDKDDNVESFEYEKEILALDNGSHYLPDYFVNYKDGTKIVIEVKPDSLVELDYYSNKINFAKKYYGPSNYIVWGNFWFENQKNKFDVEYQERLKYVEKS